MDPIFYLTFTVLVAVMFGWRQHKNLVFGCAVIMVGMVVWLEAHNNVKANVPESLPGVQQAKRKVYKALLSVDLEDQARKLYRHGIDTLERINEATPADAALAGIKPIHWLHIRRAVRDALQLPPDATPRPEPEPTPMPIPTKPPGSKRIVMQPGGATTVQISEMLKGRDGDGAGPVKPLLSIKEKQPQAPLKVIPGGKEPAPPPPRALPGAREEVPPPPAKVIPGAKEEPNKALPGAREAQAAPITAVPVVESLDMLVSGLNEKKSLRSLKTPGPATPPPPPTVKPKKTGLIVLLEAANQGPDSFTCTFDPGYGDLGAEVGETAEVKRFESIAEAEAAANQGSPYTLLVKDPIVRMANLLKRYPPDCLYPNVDHGQPRRDPLGTFAAATPEQREACEGLYNRLTKILSNQPFDKPITVEHYNEALKKLSSIKRILVLENMEQSMETLQRTQTEIRSFVLCTHHMQSPKKAIPEEVLPLLEEANKFDTQLYLHAARMFEAEANKYSPPNRHLQDPCEKDYTPVCWDGSLEPMQQRKVTRDNIQDLLVCQDSGCKAAKGRDIVCTTKRCALRTSGAPTRR
eukprot:TRINITY_DN6106_c0_g1_i1.p1 TRINITY_DN6106_c0_g1~~TRINITY_DN6106_c0_g1_i1.p1  ORF type:complete len:579 (+),score=139.84 TRINITY_DN6106_c0_g1_i1:128-1864(+)